MIIEVNHEEQDVINALRNIKRNPNNKFLKSILLNTIEDILADYERL